MRTAIAALVIATLLLTAAPGAADDEIRIEVTSIGASSDLRSEDREAKVDARLSAFSDKLTSLFAYTRYAFLGRMQVQAAFGETSLIAIPGRFTLTVEPQGFEDDRHRIGMLVTLSRDAQAPSGEGGGRPDAPEVLLRTRIRLENGGTVLLGGPPIEHGVLILALSARG